MTPLLIACKKKYRDIISIYIDAGADPNVADGAENTALHIVAMDKDKGNVEKMLQFGADTEMKNRGGDTALLLAIKGGDQTNINLVLESSCNVMEPNNKGASDYRTLSG